MSKEISNTDDAIDSRDVMARIEELRAELTDLESEATDDTNAAIEEARDALNEWKGTNGPELAALEALAKDAEGYVPDWEYGAAY